MTYKRTYSDRAEYIKRAVTLRRHRIKDKALKFMGDKCQNCGYQKCKRALGFHHLDPTKKDFAISSRGHSRSWQRVEAELRKCVLVCSNCHHEIHAGLLQPFWVTKEWKRGELSGSLNFDIDRSMVISSQAPITIGEGSETIPYGVPTLLLSN